MAKSHSREYSQLYYNSQCLAINLYEELIKKENIDCDFQRVDDYFFTTNNFKKIKKLDEFLSSFDINVNFYDKKSIFGFDVGVIKVDNQAIFHPLKFLSSLNKDFEIFENTRVQDIDLDRKILYTKNYKITANKIIIATNYPIVKLQGAYFAKMYKSNSYVVATENCKKSIKSTYHSDNETGVTIRGYNGQAVIGGLDHRTGRVDEDNKKDRLEKFAKKTFNSEISNFWCANDVMTYDGLPIIGRFDVKHRDVYIITGFNKWGMANSMIGSVLITDLISEKKNEFLEIFSPQRFNFRFGAFVTNICVSLYNILLKPLTPVFKSYKSVKEGQGRIVYYKGSKKAVYKDENKKLHICSPYCQHLNCQLKFNQNSKTWDCPCHGSRYDIDGKIISSPTVENLDTAIFNIKN